MSTSIKSYLKAGVGWAYYASRLSGLRHRGRTVILTYHRVLCAAELASDFVQPGMYVLEDAFDQQMELLSNEFEVIPLVDLLERWRSGGWDDHARYCVITFDDGWLDNYRHAFPVLKRHRLPATIFLPTDFIGTSRWFWPDELVSLLRSCSPENEKKAYAAVEETLREAEKGGSIWKRGDYDALIERCKDLSPLQIERLLVQLRRMAGGMATERATMNWDEVREMSREGISFGSHSCGHYLLTKLSEQDMRREVAGSYERLRESGASVAPVFCYPNGDYNQATQQAVKDAGYQAAVSCNPGLEGRIPADMFALNRISIHQDMSRTASLFSFAMSGLR